MLGLNEEDGVLLQTATAVVFNRENSNRKMREFFSIKEAKKILLINHYATN